MAVAVALVAVAPSVAAVAIDVVGGTTVPGATADVDHHQLAVVVVAAGSVGFSAAADDTGRQGCTTISEVKEREAECRWCSPLSERSTTKRGARIADHAARTLRY